MQGNIHIVPNLKLLHLSTLALDQLFDNEGRDGVAGISLLSVRFDDDATVNGWFMFILVLGCVVGVKGVTHVSRDQERVGDGLCKGCRCGRKSVQKRRDKAGFCTGSRDTAYLFVVEKSNTVNISFEAWEKLGGNTLGQGFNGAEPGNTLIKAQGYMYGLRLRRDKVIHTWTENELIVDSTEGCQLRIVQRPIVPSHN